MAWMAVRLRVGKPSRYVTRHLGQLSIYPSRLREWSTSLSGWGMFTCVIPYDRRRLVVLRRVSHIELYHLTFNVMYY